MEYGTTVVHPLTFLFMLLMASLVLFSRGHRVVLGVFLVCVFLPNTQRIVLGTLDFSMVRIILVLAWGRVLLRGEYRGFSGSNLDRVFAAWVAFAAIIHVLRGGSIPSGLATALDALAAFFLFRVLIRTRGQVFVFSRQMAWVGIVLGALMVLELVTQYKFILGPGRSASGAADTRRSGSLRGAILASEFWRAPSAACWFRSWSQVFVADVRTVCFSAVALCFQR